MDIPVSKFDCKILFERNWTAGEYSFIDNEIIIDFDQINNLPFDLFSWFKTRNYFEILIHELQHFKQIQITKTLDVGNWPLTATFEGKVYTHVSFFSPWEIEANLVAEKVTNQLIKEGYITTYDYNNKNTVVDIIKRNLSDLNPELCPCQASKQFWKEQKYCA